MIIEHRICSTQNLGNTLWKPLHGSLTILLTENPLPSDGVFVNRALEAPGSADRREIGLRASHGLALLNIFLVSNTMHFKSKCM